MNPSTDTALRAAHLVKSYGRRRVVDDVSLQVETEVKSLVCWAQTVPARQPPST